MAYLRKTEIEEIIKNAPPGTTPAGIVAALREQGHQLEGYALANRKNVNEEMAEDRGLIEKTIFTLGDITGVTKLGQGIAAAINAPRNQKLREETMARTNETRTQLINAIKKNREAGRDTSRLERSLAQLEESAKGTGMTFDELTDLGVTNRDVIGSAVRTAGTIASFGSYGKAAAGAQSFNRLRNVATPSAITATTVGRGVVQGAAKGAKVGATQGSIFGALQGLGLGIQDEEQGLADIAATTAGGAVAGGISGGVIGGIIGGVGGGYKARQNFKAELAKTVEGSNSPTIQRIKAASQEVADELGDDIDEVKAIEYRNSIKNSQALPIDDAIKAGDVTPEQIYSNPAKKILQPEVAKGRVLDIRLKLNNAQAGLGDEWAQAIDVNNTTYDDIVSSGLKKLDDNLGIVQRPGQTSAQAAPFRIDPKTGKIVDDLDAKTVMKATGLNADDIAIMKSGTEADRKAYERMVELATKNVDDTSGRIINRPEGVVGETALKRIEGLREQLDDAGAGINRAVRTELASKKLDTTPVYQKWVQELADEGVDVLDDGTLKIGKNSRFYQVKGAEKVLNEAQKRAIRLNNTNTPATTANTVKNQLDELLDFGNNKDTGLSGAASRLAKGLRRATDQQLDDTFTAYNTANQRYATAKTALNEVESVLGKNYFKEIGYGKEPSPVVAQRLGTIMRRVNSDAPESALRLVKALDDAAYQLELPVNDSLVNQSYFSTVVRDVYPETIPKNSFTGIVNKAAEGAGRRNFTEARDFLNRPIGKTGEIVLDFFDATQNAPEIRQAALEKYVQQLAAQ